MTGLMILIIFLLLYTGCLCHPLGVSQTLSTNESIGKNDKKGTIRISGPWHSDSALDRNIDPGEDSYVKKVISSNEGINFNKDMAEAGEMFDVNGIEDFYDKNAMVTYELNGHEIPVHLKQKYTPQTKSLFPEYNRDNTATAGAMTKSPPPESYQQNSGINCVTALQCSSATNENPPNSPDSKTTVAQQLKGDKNLFAIRNFLQLHSNQYGENHGHLPALSQKLMESSQEKDNNKELEKAYDNAVKLPWKTSVSSANLGLNEESKNPRLDERGNDLISKFSNALSSSHEAMRGDPKSLRLDDRVSELFNKFSNSNPDDNQQHSMSSSSTNSDVRPPGISESSAANHQPSAEDRMTQQQPFRNSDNKISEFTKLHSGSISNLPPIDDIHSLENAHEDLLKQYDHDHGNSLLSSKETEVANLLKKLPNQLLNTQNHENDLDSSKLSASSSRDVSDLLKTQSMLANAYHQAGLDHSSNGLDRPSNEFDHKSNSLDSSHDMASFLGMKINNFIKPPTERNGMQPPLDSSNDFDKPSTSMSPSTMEETAAAAAATAAAENENSNNHPKGNYDTDKGKAKIRILSLLGELTDKLKGVEAVVSAQHKADQAAAAHNEENSVMSKPKPPESSLNPESPADLLHNTFDDSLSNSYKPLSTMLSKFQQNLPDKEPESSHNSIEQEGESRHFSKEPDVKQFWPTHEDSSSRLSQLDVHNHDSLGSEPRSSSHDSLSSDPQLSSHDFPHNDLHEDTFHHASSHDTDLNSPRVVSGTTAQQQSATDSPSPDDSAINKMIHDQQANGLQLDNNHDFGQSDNSHDFGQIHGEYHGKIPEVDLKEANKELFSPRVTTEGKTEDNTQSSSRPSISDAELAALAIIKEKEKEKIAHEQIEKLKEQEKLLPDQIQKLRDQNKPFIMNTDSIDYNPKDHSNDETEPDRSFANITPDFKPYDDGSDEDDSERGKIVKYRHHNKLSAAFSKDNDAHDTPEDKIPEADRFKSELKAEKSNNFDHHQLEDLEHKLLLEKSFHDKDPPRHDDSSPEKSSSELIKAKASVDKEYHADTNKPSDERDHEQSSKAKDLDDRGYDNLGKDKLTSEKEHNLSDNHKESTDRGYDQSDRIKGSNEKGFSQAGGDKEKYERDYHSDKSKDSSDREYAQKEKSRDYGDSDDTHSKKNSDYSGRDLDRPSKDKGERDSSQTDTHSSDRDYPQKDKLKAEDSLIHSSSNRVSDDREYGKSSKAKDDIDKEYHSTSKAKDDIDKEYHSASNAKDDIDKDYHSASKAKDDIDKEYHSGRDRDDREREHQRADRTRDYGDSDKKHDSKDRETSDRDSSHSDRESSHSDKGYTHDKDERDGHKGHEADSLPERSEVKDTERDKETRLSHHSKESSEISDDKINPHKDQDKNMLSEKDKVTKDLYKESAHEHDDKNESKHEIDNYITGKLKEHEPVEHEKTSSTEKSTKQENTDPKTNNLLLESLGNGEENGETKSHEPELHTDTKPSDDKLISGDKKEHEKLDENASTREKSDTQTEEEKMKSKSADTHQQGKDRERTLTPKSKYIEDAEYPDYNEVKDAALFETNFIRKQFHANKVSWSDRLSDKAQQLAEKVAKTLSSDKIDQYKHPGENVAFVRLDAPNVGKEAVDTWSKESISYDFKSPSVTKKNSDFVQLAWKANNEFGMGVSKSKAGTGWVVTAFYDTPYIDRFQDLRSNLQPDNPIEDPYGDIAG